MSYDIYYWIEDESDPLLEINYTSNVSDMWERAIGFPLKFMNAMHGDECVDYLINAVTEMNNNKELFSRMYPTNGWGDFEGARNVLIKMMSVCLENPSGKFDISY